MLEEVTNISSRIALQWIPGHCQIKGNEQADSLTKERSGMNVDISLEEANTLLKAAIHQRWLEKHPSFSKYDAFH